MIIRNLLRTKSFFINIFKLFVFRYSELKPRFHATMRNEFCLPLFDQWFCSSVFETLIEKCEIFERFFLNLRTQTHPGWDAIRKWPLIRPSPTHTLCSQTKITGSGIWFERTIVWSEVTSVWGWCDQRLLRSGDGMIRGHFGLGMVWSEVTSFWVWYDQRSLRSGDGKIRGHFRMVMVWSEVD